ncbi:MAG: adenosine deaminase [Anaerolineales bacterium]|nr:adenosine deaminase [Anaerolineales bacterium]
MTTTGKVTNRDFYRSLPKIELHRHLEGSLRLSTMLEIARLHQLELPYHDVEKFRSLVQVVDGEPYTFQNFLAKFNTLRHFYQSPEAIQRVTYEAIEDAAADNIRYLELRFTPVALTRIKGFSLDEAMDWVIESVENASARYHIQVRLIASVNRHESVDLAEEVIQLAVDRLNRGILAIDLAGNEADFPGEEFAPLFNEAKQAGLHTTIHAGEWGGPDRIELAITTLGADRIGHGVRVLEDESITKLTRQTQTAFEVCPTSNQQSGAVSEIEKHPLPRMIDAGLLVTVNTDDPGISQIELSHEYQVCIQHLGISWPELKELILNAGRASFLPAAEKDALLISVSTELGAYIPR